MRLLLVLCVLASSAAFAAPCQPGPLSLYLTQGFTCDAGAFVIKSFTYQAPQGGTPASAVTVSPTDKQDAVGFSFIGPFIAGAQSSTYTLSYFIDPVFPPIIHGQQVKIGSDPGTLVTNLCGDAFPCPVGGFSAQLTVNSSDPIASTTFEQDLSTLGVQDILTVDGAVDRFANTTLLSTPEPAPIALTAFGLMGLLVFRMRAVRR